MYLLSGLPVAIVRFFFRLNPCVLNRVSIVTFCIGYYIYLTVLLSMPMVTQAETEAASKCMTTDGRQCVFPFVFDNVTYYECTWDYAFSSPDHSGKAWCGTRNITEFDDNNHES